MHTGRKQFDVQHIQLSLLATERNEFVESKKNRRDAKVVRKVRVLDEPHGAVQQNEDVKCVEQLVGGPERRENVRASRRRRKYVYDADDDDQQHSGEA